MNVCHHPGVTNALGKLGVLEKLLEGLNVHKEAKDVLEATAILLKGTCVRIHVRMYVLQRDLFFVARHVKFFTFMK